MSKPAPSGISTRFLRFPWLEFSLGTILGGLVVWTGLAGRYHTEFGRDPEAAQYERQFGPGKHSVGPEEWLIRSFFANRRRGVFLDVGAGHYRDGSNTYFLESALGWTGVAVDARIELGDGYRQHRPGTRFLAFFVSDTSGAEATLHVNPLNAVLSSSTESVPGSRGPTVAREVMTITLNDLLTELNIDRVDFVSMDIELAEPAALAGFDLQRFRPELVCIEGHLQTRQRILDYFARRDYVLVGRFLRADRFNLYFTPLPGESPAAGDAPAAGVP